MDEQRKPLVWKVDYLKKLLASASAPVAAVAANQDGQNNDSLPAIAYKVLSAVGRPLQVQEIISRAVEMKLLRPDADREAARQNLSSAFAKSIKRNQGKWFKSGRGVFGIVGQATNGNGTNGHEEHLAVIA